MAKRRKLQAPSTEELSQIEQEFRSETPRIGIGQPADAAPIAKVAADAAALSNPISSEARAHQAKLERDAETLQRAEADGLLIQELPIAEINADAIIRDRTILDEAEMIELRLSIAANGLRLPVEVYELPEPQDDGTRFALISGYRRLLAVRALHGLTGDDKYVSIKAIVRARHASDEAVVAMVEENEIRAELSQYERGRIAVISAQNGTFVNSEEAVNRLFANSSKAKRSKVRSFALIFEELGDMLAFPEALSERRGLRLAQTLRAGGEGRIREALAAHAPSDAAQEWAILEPVIASSETEDRGPSKGGRPRKDAPVSGWAQADTIETSAGIKIRKKRDGQGFLLRFEGRGIDDDLMDSLMAEIQFLLEKP